MAKFLTNFSPEDLQNNFDPLPAGIYIAEVDTSNSEIKTSPNGNDMVTVSLIVADGEYAGRKLSDQFALTKSALWKLATFLKAIGEDVSEGQKVINTDSWHKKMVKISVVQEEYNGVMRNKIKRYAAYEE